MKTRTTVLPYLTLFAAISLTACSSDSNNDPLNDPADLPPVNTEGQPIGVFNPDAATDVFACEARYYTELRGLYLGELTYTSPTDSADTCVWDASLQVRGADAGEGSTSVCNITATYSYTLLSGSDACVDGSLDSALDDPLAASTNRLDWENPSWPYDLPMLLEAGLADNAIIPAGTIAADAREVLWTFDGFDAVFLIDNNDADGTVTGTLVKR